MVLKTRMCMNTDGIPAGYPDNRLADPINEPFITATGHRCLNSITWQRDREMEHNILKDHGDKVTSYLYWSESITTVPPGQNKEGFLQILMATYTVGGMFLLQGVMSDEP